MTRRIKLEWEINNEALDKAIKRFEELQKIMQKLAVSGKEFSREFGKGTGGMIGGQRKLDNIVRQISSELKNQLSIEKQITAELKKQYSIKRKISSEYDNLGKKANNYLADLDKISKKTKEAFEFKGKSTKSGFPNISGLSGGTGGLGSGLGGGMSGGMPGGIPGGMPGGGKIPGLGGGLGGMSKLSGAMAAASIAAQGFQMYMSAVAKAATLIYDKVVPIYKSILAAASETERLKVNLALAYQAANVGGKEWNKNLVLAEKAMKRIQEIAANTPFSVNDLTEAYVKLTKRGLRPTEEQFIAIGNLAAFSGKKMDQLVEAILDAQQGSKERLKEFGIEMKTEGGKIKLSLGELKAEGTKVIETFAKLASMPGIAEAMERQSQTMQGRMGAIQDLIEQIKSDIGLGKEFQKAMGDLMAPTEYFLRALKSLGTMLKDLFVKPVKMLSEAALPDFMKVLTDSKVKAEEKASVVNKIALVLGKLIQFVSRIVNPIFEHFASIIRSVRTWLLENTKAVEGFYSIVMVLVNAVKVVLRFFADIVDTLAQLVAGLLSSVRASDQASETFSTLGAVLFSIVDVVRILAVSILKLAGTIVKAIGYIIEGLLEFDFDKVVNALKRGYDEAVNDIWNYASKEFAKVADRFTEAKEDIGLIKWGVIIDAEEKGELPGGADLGIEEKEVKDKLNEEKLKAEKEFDLAMEEEKLRHAEALLEIEEEAAEKRELAETLRRKQAEENLEHALNMDEIKQERLDKLYELDVAYAKKTIKNAKELAEELEKLKIEYEYNMEKLEIEFNMEMLKLEKELSDAIIKEKIALAQREQRVRELSLESELNDLKRKIEERKRILSQTGAVNNTLSNVTAIRSIDADLLWEEASFNAKKAKLEATLEIHKQFNNLTIEEEEKVKHELIELEKDFNQTLLNYEMKRQEEIYQMKKRMNEINADLAKQMLSTSKSELAKAGAGGNLISGLLPDTDFEARMKEMKDKINQLWDMSPYVPGAADMAAELEKIYEVQTKIHKAGKIGEAIIGTINTIAEMAQKIYEIQIANIDSKIKKNNEEIEQLKELVELEKQRNEEMLRRQEIDNKLAEQRIKELEDLTKTIPAAEQELARKQIEEQKARIKSVEDLKKSAAQKEQERIRQLEEENKRLEEEKRRKQREAFEINRAAQIAQAIISGALAAVNAFASLAAIPFVGVGMATAAAAMIGAFTAAQVALIAAQPNPYAKGTLSVEGGIPGKDSVFALLMPGEAVIPTDINKEYHTAISAIYNRKVPSYEINGFVQNFLENNGHQLESHSIYILEEHLKDLIETVRDKQAVSITIDENGFESYIYKANNETKILNKKLKLEV